MNSDKTTRDAPFFDVKLGLAVIGFLVLGNIIGFMWLRETRLEALILNLAAQKTQMQAETERPQAKAPLPCNVTTVVAKKRTWQPSLTAMGSLKAVNGVQVSSDEAGIVSDIAFQSGKPVKKGDLLVKLDTKIEEAQLQSVRVRLNLARQNLARKKGLLKKNVASQADYDAAEAEAWQAEAAVNECLANIARKTITAPFDGTLGICQVNLGQYVSCGTGIVALESSDPTIYAEFFTPQQDQYQIALNKKVRITATGIGQGFDGEVTAISSYVDNTNRNVLVQASIHNPERLLWPGMAVKVEIPLPEQKDILAIPASAINDSAVFVVKTRKNKEGNPEAFVVRQAVKPGPRMDDVVAILDGLSEGDEIVTSSDAKLRRDALVTVNNAPAVP